MTDTGLKDGKPSGRPAILVVDDEETLCEALRFNLEAAGYAVDTASGAEEALTLDLPSYSLIILDIMMGEISGTRLASILKSRPSTARIPIIFCTARDSEDDMIEGLDIGADDYVTKPYSMRGLLARVRTVLRRTAADPAPCTEAEDALRHGGLWVSPARKACRAGGCDVKLVRKEFEILALLMAHPGRVFSRGELLDRIWSGEVVLDRVIDVNITRLRAKLGEYGRLIVTHSGYGYSFA